MRRLKRVLCGWYSRFEQSAVLRELIGVASRTPLLADVWYLICGRFRREHAAVLAGRYKYMLDAGQGRDQAAAFKLRRNTHRLEKGLIMRPRRDVFAVEYIRETVDTYCALRAGLVGQPSEGDVLLLSWASEVLEEYFSVTADEPTISACRKKFESEAMPPTSDLVAGHGLIPYARQVSDLPDISIDQLQGLAEYRRSCRWYLPRAVPREVIDGAVRVAMLSPSACNRQPFRFMIFDDPTSAAEIGAIPMGTAGFSQNFPAIAVLVGQLDAFPHDRDRHLIYIDAALAAMAFQFALEVQGVSSCCINWPDIEELEKKMEQRLGLARHERPVMSISFGYADPEGQVPYSQKKSLDEIRTYAR